MRRDYCGEKGKNIPRVRKARSRRGVSQIIGTLMMLAVVAAAGTIIMIQSLQILNDYNSSLNFRSTAAVERVQEKVIITHVRFSGTTDANIYVRNAGDLESKISSISIINRDDQTLECVDSVGRTDGNCLLKVQSSGTCSPTTSPLPVSLSTDSTTVLCVTLQNAWDSDDDYKVSIVTERGNTFTKFVRPPNG